MRVKSARPARPETRSRSLGAGRAVARPWITSRSTCAHSGTAAGGFATWLGTRPRPKTRKRRSRPDAAGRAADQVNPSETARTSGSTAIPSHPGREIRETVRVISAPATQTETPNNSCVFDSNQSNRFAPGGDGLLPPGQWRHGGRHHHRRQPCAGCHRREVSAHLLAHFLKRARMFCV